MLHCNNTSNQNLIDEIKCLKNQKYKVNIQNRSRVNTDLYKKLEVGSGAMEE